MSVSAFYDVHPCHNNSIFERSICNNRGTCANETDAQCVCEGQYVKETYCRTTISEELNDANFPIYIISGIAYAVIILLILYDFVIDAKLKVWPSLKRPISLGKITLLIASISIFVQVVLFRIDHSANTKIHDGVVNMLRFLSDFLTITTYSISAISWISVILTAKGLGITQKSLTHFRRYVIIANFVLLPIYFVVGVLALVYPDALNGLFSGIIALMIIFYLSLIIGTSIFVRKAFNWIRSLDRAKKSPTTERVKLKTYFLVGANIVGILRYVFLVYTVFTFETTKSHLYRLILILSQVILFAFFLFILENHIIRLPLYLRTGEVRSNTFLSGTTRPSLTTHSKAASKSQKRKTSSGTFELSSTLDDSDKRGAHPQGDHSPLGPTIAPVPSVDNLDPSGSYSASVDSSLSVSATRSVASTSSFSESPTSSSSFSSSSSSYSSSSSFAPR